MIKRGSCKRQKGRKWYGNRGKSKLNWKCWKISKGRIKDKSKRGGGSSRKKILGANRSLYSSSRSLSSRETNILQQRRML